MPGTETDKKKALVSEAVVTIRKYNKILTKGRQGFQMSIPLEHSMQDLGEFYPRFFCFCLEVPIYLWFFSQGTCQYQRLGSLLQRKDSHE